MKDPKLTKEVIVNVGFAQKYKSLIEQYQNFSLEYRDPPVSDVLEILQEIGYGTAKYYKGENYYSIAKLNNGACRFLLNLDVGAGHVDTIFTFCIEDVCVADTFSGFYEVVEKDSEFNGGTPSYALPYTYKAPRFKNKAELKEILADLLRLAEDMKICCEYKLTKKSDGKNDPQVKA